LKQHGFFEVDRLISVVDRLHWFPLYRRTMTGLVL